MRFSMVRNLLIPQPLASPTAATASIASFDEIPHPPLNPQYSSHPDLKKHLIGKQLLLHEIPFSLEEIQEHYEHGYLILRKGLMTERGKITCQRCGNSVPAWFSTFPCSRCKENCNYCRKCLMMGRVSTCSILYSWNENDENVEVTTSIPHLQWKGTLSSQQDIASQEVVKAIAHNKEFLVWAVCGAGKTEVLFPGIQTALQEGKRVCLATPRSDVVHELTPRLRKVFSEIDIASLYGGSEERYSYTPLCITTTHQLLRFYKAFDVIILDEVDAFPYSVDETLQYATKQALKDVHSLIYLTATPSADWQKECRTGRKEFVTIPARYHRHPLPVPEFVWCGDWQKEIRVKGRLPRVLSNWLQQRIASNKQVLLFVPRIEMMKEYLPLLRKLHDRVETVHAEDPDRKEKVQNMREKETLILVTTTILERGVTFPNIDVAVLGAEDRIFTESALVQISGRVGRSAEFPDGDVVFFHYGKTEAMARAKKGILGMNREALQKGLISK